MTTRACAAWFHRPMPAPTSTAAAAGRSGSRSRTSLAHGSKLTAPSTGADESGGAHPTATPARARHIAVFCSVTVARNNRGGANGAQKVSSASPACTAGKGENIMRTSTHMKVLAVAALALGATTQARAETPSSDARERTTSPLDSPREAGPDVRVTPETTVPVDTTPAPSPLATPPAPVVPLTANGSPSTALDTDRFPPPTPQGPADTGRYSYQPAMSRVGAGVLLGGGYEDFTSNTVRDMTGAGG